MHFNQSDYINIIESHERGYGKTKKENGVYVTPCGREGQRCKSNSYACTGIGLTKKKKWYIEDSYCEIPNLEIKALLRLVYESEIMRQNGVVKPKIRRRQKIKCYKMEYIYRHKLCEECDATKNDTFCREEYCKQPKWWRRGNRGKQILTEPT